MNMIRYDTLQQAIEAVEAVEEKVEEKEDVEEEEVEEEEAEEEAVSIQLYELFNLQIEIIVCFFSLMKVCVGRYVSVFNGQRITEFLEDPYEREWASQANDGDESEH